MVRGRDTACTREGVPMYKRILVPVDGSETSDKALAAALQLAREAGGRVRILHTFDDLAYLNGDMMGAQALQTVRDDAAGLVADAMAAAAAAGVPADSKLLEVFG